MKKPRITGPFHGAMNLVAATYSDCMPVMNQGASSFV